MNRIESMKKQTHTDLTEKLGQKIRLERMKRKMSQEKLAELIDIETGSLSGIESGRHFPSLPTLEKIAINLNVELKALFDFKHLPPPPDTRR